MAAKKANSRKAKNRPKTFPELKQLRDRAQDEVEVLLKGQKDGTLNEIELKAGLREIEKRLKAMGPFNHPPMPKP